MTSNNYKDVLIFADSLLVGLIFIGLLLALRKLMAEFFTSKDGKNYLIVFAKLCAIPWSIIRMYNDYVFFYVTKNVISTDLFNRLLTVDILIMGYFVWNIIYTVSDSKLLWLKNIGGIAYYSVLVMVAKFKRISFVEKVSRLHRSKKN